MLVLAVNSGSTSAKLAAFASRGDGAPLSRVRSEHLTGATRARDAALRQFLDTLSAPVAAVAHRVVHGGTEFVHPTVIDTRIERALRALSPLAPLHNPIALEWLQAAREVCGPSVAQVAVFDTAFFAALPRVASQYALAPTLGADLGVRRYGFHGLAHEAMWRRWCALYPQFPQGGRVITLQLGGGCSIAAIHTGRPLDTSMGFSPLEGLVMATRAGDMDPAAVAYLAQRLAQPVDRIITRLNQESGLLGVSGRSADVRDLIGLPDDAARFALELYSYRARKYIGAYLAVLGGCDGIVFGGGVGEHIPELRERILAGFQWAGITLDPRANYAARGAQARISPDGAAVTVQVIPVDEEHTLARAAVDLAPTT